MDELTKLTKEYEGISAVRDVLVILYAEISENIDDEAKYLFDAYCHVNAIVEDMEKKLSLQTA